MKVPPRSTFIAQFAATAISCFVQAGTKSLLFATVDDVCGNKPDNLLSCANTKVFFTSSVIWGLIGPERLFSMGRLYHPQTLAAVIGAVLPIPVWFWVRRHPRSIFRNLNLPVLLNGGTYIPPATGINFASFLAVGFVFQFWVRRRYFAWWSKVRQLLSHKVHLADVRSTIMSCLSLWTPVQPSLRYSSFSYSIFRTRVSVGGGTTCTRTRWTGKGTERRSRRLHRKGLDRPSGRKFWAHFCDCWTGVQGIKGWRNGTLGRIPSFPSRLVFFWASRRVCLHVYYIIARVVMYTRIRSITLFMRQTLARDSRFEIQSYPSSVHHHHSPATLSCSRPQSPLHLHVYRPASLCPSSESTLLIQTQGREAKREETRVPLDNQNGLLTDIESALDLLIGASSVWTLTHHLHHHCASPVLSAHLTV